MGRHEADGFQGQPPGVEGCGNTATSRPRAGIFRYFEQLPRRRLSQLDLRLHIVDILDGQVLPVQAARTNRPPAHDKPRHIAPHERQGKSGAILIAMVQADHPIETMRRDHHFSAVGG